MENIGDWLYIVIIVIAGISSIISSVRKKARQAQEQTSQQNQPREVVIGDIFDDDFWGSEATKEHVPENKPIPVFQTQLQKQKSYSSVQKHIDYLFNKDSEGTPSEKLKTTDTIFADNEEERALITLEDLPTDIDDWRKAFIHNEILNRKY